MIGGGCETARPRVSRHTPRVSCGEARPPKPLRRPRGGGTIAGSSRPGACALSSCKWSGDRSAGAPQSPPLFNNHITVNQPRDGLGESATRDRDRRRLGGGGDDGGEQLRIEERPRAHGSVAVERRVGDGDARSSGVSVPLGYNAKILWALRA